MLLYGLTQRDSTLLAVYCAYSTRQQVLQYVQLSYLGNTVRTVPCGVCTDGTAHENRMRIGAVSPKSCQFPTHRPMDGPFRHGVGPKP